VNSRHSITYSITIRSVCSSKPCFILNLTIPSQPPEFSVSLIYDYFSLHSIYILYNLSYCLYFIESLQNILLNCIYNRLYIYNIFIVYEKYFNLSILYLTLFYIFSYIIFFRILYFFIYYIFSYIILFRIFQ
jgi:hypothetical protein